jgi:hypothetical protein
VGAEGGRGCLQPRRGGADCACRAEDGALGEVGGCFCGFEPGDARAGSGRSAQRHADAARARGRAGVGSGCLSEATGGGGAACCRSGCEGLRRAGVAIRGAGATPLERAGASGEERRRRARTACDRGGGGFRRACVWFSRFDRRAAAADCYTQHPGRDRALGGTERTADLVARAVGRGIRAGAGGDPVAHGARRGLAHDGRLDDARAVAIDRLAASLVCGMGAAARRPRRQPPPAWCHARALRVCDLDPPATRRPVAQPRQAHRSP